MARNPSTSSPYISGQGTSRGARLGHAGVLPAQAVEGKVQLLAPLVEGRLAHALEPHARLLHRPSRGRIPGEALGLHSLQVQFLEGELDHPANRLRHVAVAPVGLAEPEAEV